MRNTTKFVLIFALVLSLGCRKSDVVDFPTAITLNGNPIEKISFFSRGNVHLAVVDTFLIVQRREEKFFHIYSTNSHSLLATFGKAGKGPKEFLYPELINQTEYDSINNSPVLYVFDLKSQTMSKINILNALNGQFIENEIPLPTTRFLTFLHYKDSSFLIGSPPGKGRFFIHHFETLKDTIIPYVPETDFEIPPIIIDNVYQSVVVVNKDKGLMAAAPLYLPELDFFDLNGNYLHSTLWAKKDDFKEEMEGGLKALNNIKYQIRDIVSKGGLIYALNVNNSFTNVGIGNLKNNVKVQVFNWGGKPVRQYYLKDKRITSFAVDLNHQRIYGYSPDEKEHTIIIFKMR